MVPSNRFCGTSESLLALSHPTVVGPILLKNAMNLECYINTVHEFLRHRIERRLPRCGSNKRVQHVLQHGCLCVSYSNCLKLNHFEKNIAPM
jgi:hypothetical protein